MWLELRQSTRKANKAEFRFPASTQRFGISQFSIPAMGRQKQIDFCEFKTSLDHIMKPSREMGEREGTLCALVKLLFKIKRKGLEKWLIG